MRMNQRGSTVIENLLAMAFLSMVFYMIITGSVTLFQIEGGTSKGVSEYQVVSQLMETIKSDPAVFRKNFAPASVVDANLFLTMPYVFKGSNFTEANTGAVDACDTGSLAAGTTAPNSFPKGCDGKLAYIIRPYQNYSGIYIATIKVERAPIDANPPEQVLYKFIINSN